MAPLASSVLITGSSRGIGLELVRQLVEMKNPPDHVFATCRDPDAARVKALHELAKKYPSISVIKLEVENLSSIKAAVSVVESKLKNKGLNLLINNAGVHSIAALDTVTQQEMLSIFNTNVVGPILVVKEFLHLLKKGAKESTSKELSCSKAAIINMSSQVGSLERGLRDWPYPMYPYRTSKAALNMVTVCMAEELKGDGILCTSIHPGWVQTDMGTDQAPMSVQSSVQAVLKVLASLTTSSSGSFLDWEGKRVPW